MLRAKSALQLEARLHKWSGVAQWLVMIRMLILLVLMIASVAAFWLRFRRVVRIIAAAKPDPGFVLKDIPRRTGQFISEVLLQSKVIRERPLPGIAHAFVFWGFCAFALITINHFAEGFGITLLNRESGFQVLVLRLRRDLRRSRCGFRLPASPSVVSWCARGGWGKHLLNRESSRY